MIKTAIFVEGQTELIFVREMLLRLFNWSNISIECYTLFIDEKHIPTEYSYAAPHIEYYFQINNVGNDHGLLSRIKKREKWIWNDGFSRIIGLRDMYSKSYREVVKNALIDNEVNKKFIEAHKSEIIKFSERQYDIYFNFSIMEIEAWLLGFVKKFDKLHPQLDLNSINQALNMDFEEIDPETAFFHPSNNLDMICRLAGQRYDKKKGDVSAILSHIEKEDYLNLYEKNICGSYNIFFDSLNIPKDIL
jgi:hypothetical protein